MTDIEISRKVRGKKIIEIAKNLGLTEEQIDTYGSNKAKIKNLNVAPKSKLILVTAINPTSLGEGKTTVSIGLADAFNMLGKKVCLSLREPSLGPVFGIKGGATGGGYSQVIPMEDINLHFTGDFHAITSANNLLASFIDNHIYQGNELNINPDKIVFNRCLDLNDRALRQVRVACGEKNGVERGEKFNITAASEIMAILCLSSSLDDLKKRLGDILVAYDMDDKPIYARDLKAENAMTILLKDAIKPNLVQTLYGTPAIIHGGPFANIAHGCSSILATEIAMTYADYTITEAGFGADLGAEKFFDMKCRVANLKPDAVVLVATVRALKLHGGMDKNDLKQKNLNFLKKGMGNLYKHIENIKDVYILPVVVAINRFDSDSNEEIDFIKKDLESHKIKVQEITTWKNGAKGGVELAKEVINLCENGFSAFEYSYDVSDKIEDKIRKVASKIYGAKDVLFSGKTLVQIKEIEKLGKANLPVIIAKTQYSLSDNPKLLGRPQDFVIKIRDIELRSGAGFIVAVAGNILLMPGLPKVPAGENMLIQNGEISGLF